MRYINRLFTRHSLVRAKGEVFVLLYVFCLFFFVRSTISRQPAGQFTPNFACGRTLVPNVSSPLWGLAAPGGRKKGQMKFSLLWGIFAVWQFLSDISAMRSRIHTKYYLCRDNVCRRAPSPCGVHRPLGAGGGELKTQKN